MGCQVNKTLLPVKSYYLWFFAAMSCSMPFIPHFLQQKGYSTGDVSTILAIVPFVIIFSKPLIGNYADTTGRYKCTMFCCLLTGAIFFSMLYFISPFDNDGAYDTPVNNNFTSNETLINIITSHAVSQKTHFNSYQFWLVMIIITISNAIGLSPSFTIVDTVTMNMLKDKPEDFGKQRMWMSIGLGAAILFVSAIMDAISAGQHEVNYMPMFISFLFCLLISAISVYFLKPVESDNKSLEETTDKGLASFLPTLKNWKILLFLFMTFVFGANWGQSMWMTVWYMKEMGAQQITFATSVLVNAITTMIASFFSGFVIRKIGHELCLVFCLAALSVRAWLWTLIWNSWHGVPFELLSGLATGLWFAVMVSYANKIAPEGCETSSQSILSGVYDGLGNGVGNLASGWIYFYLGGLTTWRIFGTFTGGCAVVYFIVIMFTDRPNFAPQASNQYVPSLYTAKELESMESKPLKSTFVDMI